jgi:hypothetical protein
MKYIHSEFWDDAIQLALSDCLGRGMTVFQDGLLNLLDPYRGCTDIDLIRLRSALLYTIASTNWGLDHVFY